MGKIVNLDDYRTIIFDESKCYDKYGELNEELLMIESAKFITKLFDRKYNIEFNDIFNLLKDVKNEWKIIIYIVLY